VADEPVLSRRRQSADERLLRGRGADGYRRPVRRGGGGDRGPRMSWRASRAGGPLSRVAPRPGPPPRGAPRACHAIAVDARAPKFDGGIVTRLDCIPLGIVVNERGERFADAGEDLWPKRYAD